MNNSSPILLIIFNRPDSTKIVFEAIRKAKPEKLYVSADAPRSGNEKDIVNSNLAREIVKNVDWECETHYRFLETNLGCGLGVSSAISWAFENEDRLIILEDDCVPSLPFFGYCNYMLNKYNNDSRVWVVAGRSHHSDNKLFKSYDYIFSRNSGHCWGWATWKRCWENFTFDIEVKWSEFIKIGGFNNVFLTKEEAEYFNKKYEIIFRDKNVAKHSWSWHFAFAFFSNGGLSVVPSKNLIENIGKYGVHSNSGTSFHELKAAENYVIENEPSFIISNKEYDYVHYKKHWRKLDPDYIDRLLKRIKKLFI